LGVNQLNLQYTQLGIFIGRRTRRINH